MKKTKGNLILKLMGIAIFAVMLFSLSGCGSSPSATDSRSAEVRRPTLIIYNQTGLYIYRINVSSSDDELWGPDLLGDNVLAPIRAFQVTFPSMGLYDIRLIDENGDSYSWYRQNVDQVTTYELIVEPIDKDPPQN